MIGVCNSKKSFGFAPWVPREESKGQISLNFNNKVNFKDFLYQTLCVFLQIKDMEQGFCSAAGSCPRVGLGGTLGGGGQIF